MEFAYFSYYFVSLICVLLIMLAPMPTIRSSDGVKIAQSILGFGRPAPSESLLIFPPLAG